MPTDYQPTMDDARRLAADLSDGIAVLYRGGGDGHWLTTSRQHAAQFGAVRAYRVEIHAAEVMASDDAALADLDVAGMDADGLDAIAAATHSHAVIVPGWEGDGITVYIPDLDRAVICGVEG